MLLPAQSTVAWKVCISLLQALAIGSTLVRLWHRWQIKKMWWDDWVTIVPLIADILYFTTMWLHFKSKLSGHLFVSFWFNNILFLLIVWVSRMSLSLSIVRIFPPNHICRRYGFGLTVTFLVLCIATILMSALDCYDKSIPQWYNVPLPLCIAKRKSVVGGIYLAIAFDYVADILLVVSPLVMLWRIRLPGQQRRIILVLFSCSILSLLASVFFSATGLVPIAKLGPSAFLILAMGAQLQAGVTLIVCNIIVVAMFFYVVSKRERAPSPEVESNDSKGSAGKTPERLRQVPATADRRGTSLFRSFFGNNNNNNNTDTCTSIKTDTNNKSNAKSKSNADADASPTQSHSKSSLELTSIYEDSSHPSGEVSRGASSRQTRSSESKINEDEDPQIDSKSTAAAWSFPASGASAGEGTGVMVVSYSSSASQSQSHSHYSQVQSPAQSLSQSQFQSSPPS